mmetsp:Transcript_120403/g.179852  ORF Transcript_120403/g.179852 Transcript_120403/m.179852 type:complete len:112 (-) Transcript_120403:172-507(-)
METRDTALWHVGVASGVVAGLGSPSQAAAFAPSQCCSAACCTATVHAAASRLSLLHRVGPTHALLDVAHPVEDHCSSAARRASLTESPARRRSMTPLVLTTQACSHALASG